MNSSKTWKSGEMCRIPGSYECVSCGFEDRRTVKEFELDQVLPMCDSCVEKDATWKLVRVRDRVAGR